MKQIFPLTIEQQNEEKKLMITIDLLAKALDSLSPPTDEPLYPA